MKEYKDIVDIQVKINEFLSLEKKWKESEDFTDKCGIGFEMEKIVIEIYRLYDEEKPKKFIRSKDLLKLIENKKLK